MAGRNIIWCQTSDPKQLAQLLNKKYTHVIISALHLQCVDGNYVLYLNDTLVQNIDPAFWDVVRRLRSAGVTVTALLGGYGGGYWSCINSNPDKAISVLSGLANAPYYLQGFDLDWEFSPYDPNAPAYDPKLIAYVTVKLATAGSGLVITHAPTPDLLGTYDAQFWQAVGNTLAWINVQWYGDSDLVQDYSDFVSGQTSGAPVDPTRVVAGATVMTQQGVGYTDLCQLMSMVTTLQKTSGIGQKFGGVAGWEFTQTIGNPDPKVSNWDTCIAAALQGQTKCVACQ
jgi:hypothetical protein